ncbi:hypothetical protein DPMN_043322 [Dreissena polymorpha]|uniref:LRAT domain-containing protein n=1 Tax=Dreissena polymorpha TaxID=45954 RepID=A0A9D4HXQ7_DREPO|nr:hypothetical protein DPMN_043322 [Dreissena polymorpha]
MAYNARLDALEDVPADGEEITQLRRLQVGDHIATPGKIEGVKYFHHGIYLGFSKGVADFGGENILDAKTRVVDVMEFMNGRLFRINYPSAHCLPPEETVSKALDLVDNPSNWNGYDVVRNNCEHFATFCKTGKAASRQVIEVIRQALTTLGQSIKKAAKASSGSLS